MVISVRTIFILCEMILLQFDLVQMFNLLWIKNGKNWRNVRGFSPNFDVV